MRRRDVLLLLSGLAGVAGRAQAQSLPRAAKLAILSPDSPSSADLVSGSLLASFLRALQELGYAEGRNLEIQFRFAEDHLDRLPKLAAELTAWRPDVIYTYTSGGAQAAANATKSIPIVVGPAGEDVLLRLAGNLARPVGNVTGVALEGVGVYEKCLELLKEVAPGASRIGVLLNHENPAWSEYPAILAPTAASLGLVLLRLASKGASDIDPILAGLRGERLDALLILNDSTFSPNGSAGARIVAFARERRVPSASSNILFAQHGGLLALGSDQTFLRRRAAEYVRKIIEGERPAELPVERQTRFHIAINLVTAKAIDVTIPPALLARADEVIE